VKQDGQRNRLLALLAMPALRIPLFLAATIGLSIYAMYSCQEQMRTMKLMRRRHTSFIRLLAQTISEQEKMPVSLGALATPGAGAAEHSRIEEVFLRHFADLEEFTRFASPEAASLERLGNIGVWRAPHGKPDDGQEIAWEGYIFRMEPGEGDTRDFAIFSWPLEAGPARLTLAYISTDPASIYYTVAGRYTGPGKGPRVADLGEAPFEGRIFILPPDSASESAEDFRARAAETDGRIWAVEKLHVLPESYE